MPRARWGAGQRRVRLTGVGEGGWPTGRGAGCLRWGRARGGGRLWPAEATPGRSAEPACSRSVPRLAAAPGLRLRSWRRSSPAQGKAGSGPGARRSPHARDSPGTSPHLPHSGLSLLWALPAAPRRVSTEDPSGFLTFWNFSLGPSFRFPRGSALSLLSSPRKSLSVL